MTQRTLFRNITWKYVSKFRCKSGEICTFKSTVRKESLRGISNVKNTRTVVSVASW